MTLIVTNFRVQPSNLLAFIPLTASEIIQLLASNPRTGLQCFLDQFCVDHGFEPQDQIFFLISGMKALREVDEAQYHNNNDALVSLQYARHTHEIDLDHPSEDVQKLLYTHFEVLGVF